MAKQRTVGIIGGMSWESTVSYYQAINRGINARMGDLHSASLLLHSVDFQPVSQWQHNNDWTSLTDHLVKIAVNLEKAGAQGMVIATNTMHKVAPEIEAQISVPLIHIADATAMQCQLTGMRKVALLGTRFTMEQPFYISRLKQQGIDVITPDVAGRQAIHDIIYQELCRGEIRDSSRQIFQQIIEQMGVDGAQAAVLGCTEIGLLIGQQDVSIPVLDTAQIHAAAIVDFMLAES
ncbi:aspartate/glutamate racemase family protein [Alteromonas pelagimontana]|uniref:Aspartate/glutamate racemase family protein n=1 Tax=Alteromonas pelagimontana TaxID=1858656 RepID=A0A6M4MAJ6_9ALTE|nr:aspartate/glutamate racemase family protein [Alteromonas pelagimontana]QJR80221.1 aspartate/glutamate racemase family protein [Alteromonas pelagimontana]